jgi:hypothetical protein
MYFVLKSGLKRDPWPFPRFELLLITLADIQKSSLTADIVSGCAGQPVRPGTSQEEMTAGFLQKYRERGFIIIAINDGESQKDVLQFVKDYQLTFPVWLDPTHIATEKAFHTLNLPSSFVIDRNGTIRLAWIGRISSGMLEEHVTPLIKEQ